MKKKNKHFLLLLAIFTLLISSAMPVMAATRKSNSITASNISIPLGTTKNLGAKGKTTLSYKSSNPSILGVDSKGNAKAKRAGTVTVTIYAKATSKYNSAKKNITVTVYKRQANSITYSNISVNAKESKNLKAKGKTSLTYTSSNTKVATVDSKGNVKGISAGTVTITIKAKATSKYDSLTKKVTLAILPARKQNSITASDISLTIGQTQNLNAKGKTSIIKYESANPKIATVDSKGNVKGISIGNTTIRITAKDTTKYFKLTKTINIQVTAVPTATPTPTVSIPSTTVPVSSVSLNKTSVTLTEQFHGVLLEATVTPSNATNKALEWKSSNTNVAVVDSSGGVIALANGTATITATTKDGSNKSASCKVIVNIPPPSEIIQFIRLDKTALEFKGKGQTATLKATPLLGDYTPAPLDDINKALTWESYDTAIATVDANGKVTAVGNGMTTIVVTAKENNYAVAYCRVTVNIAPTTVAVSSVSLNKTSATLTAKGATTTLTATVAPSNADNKSVTWSTDNSAVATVNSSGVVTAVANGSCNITARTADGGKTSSCKVTVNIATTPSNPTSISLAGGKSKIIGFASSDVPTGTDLTKITYEMQGSTNCIEVLSSGYVTLAQKSMFQMKGLKTGSVKVIAKYNGTVLKIWNITVTSNWDVYIAYENWKRGVEAKIWNSSMNTVQKLDALENYIKTEFKYSMDSPGASNRLYAYQYMMCDCFGASDMFGDMAKDINPNLQVGYVDYPTGKIYTYMSDAVANSHGHMNNAVYINGQWVGYDAQPPVNG